MSVDYVLFTVLLTAPLCGFFLNGIRFRSKSAIISGTIATTAATISFIATLMMFLKLQKSPDTSFSITYFDWINVGNINVQAKFVFDHLSAIMALIITGVGSLIHLFSIGYMSHDEHPTKYFSYLNLFLFNMLILVLGSNLLVMFIGWEGVGLCSYLLIGFWFSDEAKAAAGMKAFITNRIGDAGFLLGLFFILATFGTLEFIELSMIAPVKELGWTGPITLATLFLFIGATGKSAQIPLYVWLPDAMAGPTPVSALIHAATMVTAGVYMIVRLNPIFLAAPNTLMVISLIGVFTAFFAATIGVTQWDIKKILAYSTVSQLGYMFLAVGVGAFGAGIFHLMTHAFFKALLFLGSGSVIHAMSEVQDIRQMGALKNKLPITHLTFFIGWLAIIGMPPFAGFFSKDEILWLAFQGPNGHWFFWLMGLIGAALTSFYMTRLMCFTFWGKSRISQNIHPHEAPPSMYIPLMALAILSVVGGWLGIPHILGELLPGHPTNFIENWLSPNMAALFVHGKNQLEVICMILSVVVSGFSAFLAYYFYIVNSELPVKISGKFSKAYLLVSNKYKVDEFYQKYLIQPVVESSKNLWTYVDIGFIDQITYLLSDMIKEVAQWFKSFQNGNFQKYAMYISVGIVSVLVIALILGG